LSILHGLILRYSKRIVANLTNILLNPFFCLQRLKHVTPRQSDLELQGVIDRFHEKQIEMEKVAFKERFLEQERIRDQQQKERKLLMDRSRAMKLKQSEMVARIQYVLIY